MPLTEELLTVFVIYTNNRIALDEKILSVSRRLIALYVYYLDAPHMPIL